MKKIDTIIFDLGGVLIDWKPMNIYFNAFDGDEKKALWFLDTVCSSSWNASLDKGKDWHEAINEKILEFPEYEKYIRLYKDEWKLMLNGEISGTVEILKKLKASGKYHIYSITNWSTETYKITYETYDFLKLFDGIEVSGNLKMIKPEKEIYLYTLQKYNITPEKSVFIDDRLENVATANLLGINGIQFINPTQLQKSLIELNIEL